ncbi:YdaS family helix-turn-helix protein [Paracidovorax anthurii]|uniref:YdaS family helix-turn-helix protein n=1 Tax=Paracidovorax anthurii TaxID=78229 RepID=UPI000DD05453
MKLKTWLLAGRGRTVALSRHLGVSKGRVSQMADSGVPPKYMLSVRDFTGGEVTVESLVQDRTPSTSDLLTQPTNGVAALAPPAPTSEVSHG